MLPAWATVLIALGGAAIAGVLAGWLSTSLRIRHEREEQLRERMIAAADDFATTALQAQLQLWEAALETEQGGTVMERLPEARRLIGEAHARLARVRLLFGTNTDAGASAMDVITELWTGRGLLERPDPAIGDAMDASGRALERLNEFSAHAREALKTRWDLGEPRFAAYGVFTTGVAAPPRYVPIAAGHDDSPNVG